MSRTERGSPNAVFDIKPLIIGTFHLYSCTHTHSHMHAVFPFNNTIHRSMSAILLCRYEREICIVQSFDSLVWAEALLLIFSLLVIQMSSYLFSVGSSYDYESLSIKILCWVKRVLPVPHDTSERYRMALMFWFNLYDKWLLWAHAIAFTIKVLCSAEWSVFKKIVPADDGETVIFEMDSWMRRTDKCTKPFEWEKSQDFLVQWI